MGTFTNIRMQRDKNNIIEHFLYTFLHNINVIKKISISDLSYHIIIDFTL